MEKREPDKIPNGQEDKKKADRRKKKKIKLTIWRILQFLANPRFLLCFGLAWLITNGWCYILFGIGTCLSCFPLAADIAGKNRYRCACYGLASLVVSQ